MGIDDLIIQCAWCKQYQRPDGEYDKNYIPANLTQDNVSHGICPLDLEKWNEDTNYENGNRMG